MSNTDNYKENQVKAERSTRHPGETTLNPTRRSRKKNTSSAAHRAARLVLILGGARSGKSTFAVRLAHDSERRVAFIATATASDQEMRARIAHHRASRPSAWPTIEEPLDLVYALQQAAALADVLLLDCMTLWLSNWLWQHKQTNFDQEPTLSERYSEEALQEINRLLETLTTLPGQKTLVVVSNEVGLGIHPDYTISRIYRDILGRINQRLAQTADRVYLMIAGLGVDIKRLHEEARL
jgi:adenosylcobinamide kinase/adenosylcobinamide-phosphate guanylyltransferase